MHHTAPHPVRAGALALTSAALAVGGLAAPSNAQTPAADAPSAPVIVAHMGKNISLSRDSVRAGQVTFRVVSRGGAHELQIARLRHGYTLQQAGADINKAFGGDIAAINRVDRGVDFRGGAEAHPNRPGMFTTFLGRGHYLALDQNGNGLAMLDVRGTSMKRSTPRTASSIDVYTYGFDAPHSIPRRGWVKLANKSDQPHFVEFQRIRQSTTRAQIKKALSPSDMNSAPPTWVMHASTSTGVFSNGRSMRLRYDLPAGKYLVACFWPDRDTGMPHAFMGMWTVVHLR